MKKNYLSYCCLFVLLLSTQFVDAQCIRSLNAYSNTSHSITINNPIGADNNPIFPPLGTYNLTLNYLGEFGSEDLLSSAAMVTISNSSQIVITDNSIEFPTGEYGLTGTLAHIAVMNHKIE